MNDEDRRMRETVEDIDTAPIFVSDERVLVARIYETGAVNGAPITTGKASGEIIMVSDDYIKTQTRFGWAIVGTIAVFILLGGLLVVGAVALLRLACFA